MGLMLLHAPTPFAPTAELMEFLEKEGTGPDRDDPKVKAAIRRVTKEIEDRRDKKPGEAKWWKGE